MGITTMFLKGVSGAWLSFYNWQPELFLFGAAALVIAFLTWRTWKTRRWTPLFGLQALATICLITFWTDMVIMYMTTDTNQVSTSQTTTITMMTTIGPPHNSTEPILPLYQRMTSTVPPADPSSQSTPNSTGTVGGSPMPPVRYLTVEDTIWLSLTVSDCIAAFYQVGVFFISVVFVSHSMVQIRLRYGYVFLTVVAPALVAWTQWMVSSTLAVFGAQTYFHQYAHSSVRILLVWMGRERVLFTVYWLSRTMSYISSWTVIGISIGLALLYYIALRWRERRIKSDLIAHFFGKPGTPARPSYLDQWLMTFSPQTICAIGIAKTLIEKTTSIQPESIDTIKSFFSTSLATYHANKYALLLFDWKNAFALDKIVTLAGSALTAKDGVVNPLDFFGQAWSVWPQDSSLLGGFFKVFVWDINLKDDLWNRPLNFLEMALGGGVTARMEWYNGTRPKFYNAVVTTALLASAARWIMTVGNKANKRVRFTPESPRSNGSWGTPDWNNQRDARSQDYGYEEEPDDWGRWPGEPGYRGDMDYDLTAAKDLGGTYDFADYGDPDHADQAPRKGKNIRGTLYDESRKERHARRAKRWCKVLRTGCIEETRFQQWTCRHPSPKFGQKEGCEVCVARICYDRMWVAWEKAKKTMPSLTWEQAMATWSDQVDDFCRLIESYGVQNDYGDSFLASQAQGMVTKMQNIKDKVTSSVSTAKEEVLDEAIMRSSPMWKMKKAQDSIFILQAEDKTVVAHSVKIGQDLLVLGHVKDVADGCKWVHAESGQEFPAEPDKMIGPFTCKNAREPVWIQKMGKNISSIKALGAQAMTDDAEGDCAIHACTRTKDVPDWTTTVGRYKACSIEGGIHIASTVAGWSGTPVINANGAAIGLHSAGGPDNNLFVPFDQVLLDFLSGKPLAQ